MNLILSVVYALLAGLALLGGWLYPEVKSWSYMAAGSFGVYLILSLILIPVWLHLPRASPGDSGLV